MPAGDGTGPMGLGPMTGRMAGYCAGYPVPGFMNPIGGRGYGGWGRGGGRGHRNRFYATGLTGWQRMAMGWPGFHNVPAYAMTQPMPFMAQEQELEVLKRQEAYIINALEGIKKRMDELESSTAGHSEA